MSECKMELFHVYNTFYAAKKEYCVICLRSSEDRRMVNIKSLENFIKSVNLPFNYTDNFQKICYVCERQAAAAHRFRLAVNLSASVHNLFLLMHAGKTRLDLFRQINGQKAASGVMRNVPEWEQRLKGVRASTQLLQTEVLCVNSLLQNGTQVEGLPPGGEADVYVIPDAPPGAGVTGSGMERNDTRDRVHDVLSEPEIYMDSVVILDEEEDPINIKVEEPGLNEMAIDEINISGSNAATIVPIETLLHSHNTSEMAIIENAQTIMQRNPTDSTNFLLHPIVEKNGVLTVPSFAAQIIDGQLVTMNKSNVTMQTPKLALENGLNFDLLTDLNQVADVLKSISTANAKKYFVVSDVIPINVLESNVMQTANFVNHNPVTLGNVANVLNVGAAIGDNGNVGHALKVSNVVGNVRNGRSRARNNIARAQNNTTNIMYLQNAEPTNADTQNGRPLVNTETGPASGHLLKALAGFTPTQVYSKGIQHISINTNEGIFIEDDGRDETSAQSEKEMIAGKRCQSETENTKRSRLEGDGKQQNEKPAQRETDWEDKIPMDVISFMDATDPNADTVLKPPEPPLAVISDVHTVVHGDLRSGENDPATGTSRGENQKSSGQKQKLSAETPTNSGMLMIHSGTFTGNGITPVESRGLGGKKTVKRRRTKNKVIRSSDWKQASTDDVIDLC